VPGAKEGPSDQMASRASHEADGGETRDAQLELAGLPISSIRTPDLIDRVFRDLSKRRGGWLVTANLDFIQRAAESAEVRNLYARARDAASRAAARLRSRLPGIRVVGCSSPQLSPQPTPEEIDPIRREVMGLRPDLLYAGLGSPKQEYVIDALRRDLPEAWMMGCGISLSFLAGDVPRAPHWMRHIGLEWFHRMVHDPRRLAPRYLTRNLPFAVRLLVQARLRRGNAIARCVDQTRSTG